MSSDKRVLGYVVLYPRCKHGPESYRRFASYSSAALSAVLSRLDQRIHEQDRQHMDHQGRQTEPFRCIESTLAGGPSRS